MFLLRKLSPNYKSVWQNAVRPNPANLCSQPNQHGRILVDGRYTIDWFDGEQMPRNISQILVEYDSAIASDAEEDAEMSHSEPLYGSD